MKKNFKKWLAVLVALAMVITAMPMQYAQAAKKNKTVVVKTQEQLEEAQRFAKELETKEVVLSIKAGEGGKTFGSVSSKEIASAYKEQCGITIDKKKIQLPESIKNFGVYEVKIKLHPKVTGTLKVKVKEQ